MMGSFISKHLMRLNAKEGYDEYHYSNGVKYWTPWKRIDTRAASEETKMIERPTNDTLYLEFKRHMNHLETLQLEPLNCIYCKYNFGSEMATECPNTRVLFCQKVIEFAPKGTPSNHMNSSNGQRVGDPNIIAYCNGYFDTTRQTFYTINQAKTMSFIAKVNMCHHTFPQRFIDMKENLRTYIRSPVFFDREKHNIPVFKSMYTQDISITRVLLRF